MLVHVLYLELYMVTACKPVLNIVYKQNVLDNFLEYCNAIDL